MRDVLAEIWSTVRRNKLRTALTGFAVAWGIFMIIFLLGAGNGLIKPRKYRATGSRQLDDGGRRVYVEGLRRSERRPAHNPQRQRQGPDRPKLQAICGGHRSRTAAKRHNAYKGRQLRERHPIGRYPNEVKINKKEMLYGRFINQIDIEQSRKSLVLSEDDAKELLPGDVSNLVGQYVNVGDMAFRVVGIYEADKSGMNRGAFIPFTTFRTIYNKGDEVGNIVFSFHGLETEKDNEEFETQYRARINGNHRAAPDDEGAVWIWNRFTQNMQMNKGIGIIQTALWIIGLFTLLSGIVGVSNIMLITVKERTREFGIRKAIGAKPLSILRLIITESIIITTFFGYIGMVLGVAANAYMDATIGRMKVDSGLFEATMFYNPTVGIGTCISATVVMIVAGTLAGLIPARKAAKIRPIEALRAE